MSIRYTPRWPLLVTLVLGVAALIGLTYATTEPSGDARPTQGGRYVEGVAGAVSRVNPLLAANDAERDVATLVFSGLVRLGPKGNVLPDLAEALPSIGPDGKTYTFKLRRGLRWHDGTRLTASDVAFTIEAIQDPAFAGDPSLRALFAQVEVETPDEQTVVLTLSEPFAPFLAFATVGILPRHRLSGLRGQALITAPFFERPVGAGPYRLRKLTPSGAVLEANAEYALGAPLVTTLELRFYRDEGALLNALLAEEIDGAFFHNPLSAEQIAALDQDERWVRRSLHGTAYSLVYLNAELPALKDAQVRQALQHALDRERLIEEALEGQALAVDSPIAPDLWAYVSFGDAYRFDRRAASKLLETAGWRRDGQGWRKDGAALRFTLATVDDPTQVRVADAIARQWRSFGVQVEVHAMSAAQFHDEVVVRRRFQAALSTVAPPGPDPDPYPFWHSTQALGEGLNLSGFSNVIVDQVLESARQTPSQAQRAEDYRLFQEIFAGALPALLLYTPTYQYVVTADLHGLSPGLLFSSSARFFDAHRWFLKSASSEADDG